MNSWYDYICCVHICCWWLYMLCAYMLLVIIYVTCIYGVGDYICCVHICCWWISLTCYWWWIVGVSMYWNMLVWPCEICMKYVLLLSSPSSHTQLLLAFISMLVLDTYVFIMRVVMMCLLHQGRRARRWKLVPHAPIVGLDTSHVLGRVVSAYVFEVNMLLVHLCALWLIIIVEPYACTFIDENNLCPCLFMED